jgi:hypothetical protein
MRELETLDQLRALKLRRKIRQEQLQIMEDVLGWVASKSIGSAAVFIGIMELVKPDFFPFVLTKPEACVAFGMALVLGKRFIGIAGRMIDAFKLGRGGRNG